MIQLCVVPDLGSTTNKTPTEQVQRGSCNRICQQKWSRNVQTLQSPCQDKNAGQNPCNCSGHVPSSNLHNKPIAAA